jgi:hypothetical protein
MRHASSGIVRMRIAPPQVLIATALDDDLEQFDSRVFNSDGIMKRRLYGEN